MKPYKTHFKNTYDICIYGILLISAILPALFAVKHIKISPDSMVYALISQEIVSGHGIKIPMIYDFRDHLVFINGSVPYLGEPPLLPILFALLGGVTPQSFLPVQIINVISHVVTTIFTFLLMKRLYNNKLVALLTGMLVSISFPLLWDANRMLTESLFIALTAAMLYFLILSRYSERGQSIGFLFIASICISAAILTRFAGVSLIPVFFWGIFILVKNKSVKLKNVFTILAMAVPFITVGVLFTITYIISGTIFGWDPPSPGRSYLSALAGTINMIFFQFHLDTRAVTLVTLFVILFFLYIIVSSNVRREMSKYFHSGLDLIIVFIISYTVLISLAMTKTQTFFELRFMHPLVPFLFILCIIMLVAVMEMVRFKGFSKLSLCGMILSLGIITFGTCYKTYLNSGYFSHKDGGHYLILDYSTYKWIKENYEKDVIITTNKPYHLSFFGGYSTIRLPHKRFEKNTPIPDNMETFLPDRMSKFGSRVLVLFGEVDEQHEGSYLAKLFNKREDDDNFVLIRAFSDGVVYQLRE
jgi:4-amino-4-deoxy-L-arabinose transferase-like glycosyltransferase